jgi:predicted DNA-binding helix-hairpin-helix protein
MARLRVHIDDAKGEARDAAHAHHRAAGASACRARPPHFAPAGQSTQMIVGADATDDATILATSASSMAPTAQARLLLRLQPHPRCRAALPLQAPPLVREHRLYQADWLMRFYGFEADEIASPRTGGMLRLDVDPKLAWALAHEERFPVDLDRAPREMLLRVPGLGVKAVDRLLLARRVRRLRADDLKRLHVPTRKVLPFVAGRPPAGAGRCRPPHPARRARTGVLF